MDIKRLVSYYVYIEFVHAYFAHDMPILGSASKLSTIYVRGYVYVY